jgi:hypothetical protein
MAYGGSLASNYRYRRAPTTAEIRAGQQANAPAGAIPRSSPLYNQPGGYTGGGIGGGVFTTQQGGGMQWQQPPTPGTRPPGLGYGGSAPVAQRGGVGYRGPSFASQITPEYQAAFGGTLQRDAAGNPVMGRGSMPPQMFQAMQAQGMTPEQIQAEWSKAQNTQMGSLAMGGGGAGFGTGQQIQWPGPGPVGGPPQGPAWWAQPQGAEGNPFAQYNLNDIGEGAFGWSIGDARWMPGISGQVVCQGLNSILVGSLAASRAGRRNNRSWTLGGICLLEPLVARHKPNAPVYRAQAGHTGASSHSSTTIS